MKIVILDGFTENPGDLSWEPMEKLGTLTVYDRTSYTDQDEIVSRIGDAEIVYTNKTPLPEAVIARCPKLKMIGVLATGYNVVDVQAAAQRHIPVCNIPTYGTQAVAQFTMALLLELCHHVGDHSAAVHQGRWEHSKDFCFWDYPLMELAGKTMGIIGYGHIGQATAQMARAFGMHVLTTSRRQRADCVDLATLLAQSDVISLHCPLTAETEHLINEKTLAQMKDGVLILNTGRGPLVDEQALADALNRGKVAGAAVDVVSAEPIRGDNPLLTAKNCIITPHIAWASKESRQRLMDCAVENLRAFLDGTPIHVVNGVSK